MSTTRSNDPSAHEPRPEPGAVRPETPAPTPADEPRGPETNPGAAPASPTAPSAELERRLASLDRALARVTESLGRLERREEALRAARSAGAVRPEEVARLIERDLEGTPSDRADPGASVQAALAALRRRQPGLFGATGGARGAGPTPGASPGASAGMPPGLHGRAEGVTPGAAESLEGLRRAARAGDRRSLLEYLRARRGG